jgi:hypothetical protein
MRTYCPSSARRIEPVSFHQSCKLQAGSVTVFAKVQTSPIASSLKRSSGAGVGHCDRKPASKTFRDLKTHSSARATRLGAERACGLATFMTVSWPRQPGALHKSERIAGSRYNATAAAIKGPLCNAPSHPARWAKAPS